MKFKYTKSTLRFTIVGIFIPGLTMIAISGIQIMLAYLINNCELAWDLLFVFMSIGAVIMPFTFGYQAINWDLETDEYRNNILTYNLIEYTFLQVSLGWIFSNSNTLCYVSDGQNGLEFAFTAWIGLIILNIYSLILDLIHNKNHT